MSAGPSAPIGHAASSAAGSGPTLAQRLARIYSNVVSPPSVFAVLGPVVAWAELPFWPGLGWGALYAVLISGIPMLLVVYLLRTGRVGDLHMRHGRERHLPYLMTFSCAALALILVHFLGGPRLLETLLYCNLIGLAVLGIVNTFWLISNHAGSIVLAMVYVGFVYGLWGGLAVLPLVLLVFVARLVLRRHTIAQLIAGTLAGALPALLFARLGFIP